MNVINEKFLTHIKAFQGINSNLSTSGPRWIHKGAVSVTIQLGKEEP